MSENILIINCKNYVETTGDDLLLLADYVSKVSNDLGVKIYLAPPTSYISLLSNLKDILLLSQHSDSEDVGGTTGYNVIEILKIAGCSGSLVNHSEKRISQSIIDTVVTKLRKLNMLSVVCARTPSEVNHLARLNPDYIAIEPPELIGSGIAVSNAQPEIISDSVKAAKSVNPKVQVICGAGIVKGEDVSESIKLGASGILVASGITKSNNKLDKLIELANYLSN